MGDKKIHIKMGTDNLTKEELSSHKNFNEVYNNFLAGKGNPIKVTRKITWVKGVAFVTVTAVFVVGAWRYAIKTETHTAPTHNTRTSIATTDHHNDAKAITKDSTVKVIAKKPFIHPPIKGVDVPYKTFIVDAKKGGVLTYNKSKITIPAKAFCDEKGDDITGKVDIAYREFHDPVDFFVSGIPMTYDSGGVQYTFESAGMLDMQGSQDGKQVYIKNGKSIKVAMSSFQTGTAYNIYQLDTVMRNWTYIDESKYKVIKVQKSWHETEYKIEYTEKYDSASTEPPKPVKPVKVTGKYSTLNIDADANKFPELAVYKNMVFEVDSTDKAYDPQWQRMSWREAKPERMNNSTDYVFTVSSGEVKHDIRVHPAFKGKNYTEAMKEYNLKYEQYKTEIAKQEAEKKRMKEDYNKRMADLAEKSRTASERAHAECTVTQFLSLNKFGIWNCDKPCQKPKGAELLAHFTDQRNDDLDGLNFFIVQKGRNAIFEFYPGRIVEFNPNEKNFAWLITQDNKLAVYSEDDFKQIKQKSGKYTFLMKINDIEINGYTEIKEILKPYM